MEASPTPGAEPAREAVPGAVVSIPARRLKWLQLLAVANGVLGAAMFCALLYTVPRSVAYTHLLDENLALKERLDDIDDKMSEVDRMLLRLRLYGSQLESLSTPEGDHGPVEFSDVLERIDFQAIERPPAVDGAPLEPDQEEGLRSADAWADAVSNRADAFIESMKLAEPNLADLVVELEDVRALEAALPSRWPAKGDLTSGYGWRRNPVGRRGYRFHSGLDVANRRGTPIFAAADGTVIRAQWNSGYGRVVEIDHGYGITTVYAHCNTLAVKRGDHVVKGRNIAAMGSTGRSTGPHLHFEVRLDGNAVDPRDYLPRSEGR